MIIDYYKMYKKKGLIKIFKYFYEAHLYDLIYNIETHYFNNKKKNFTNDSLSTERDVRNYISYQVSWTSEIRRSFDFLNKYFKKNSFHFKNFTFVDAGSGKGKVLFEWYRLTKKFKFKQKIVGVEIKSDYHQVAKKNISKLGLQKKIIVVNKGILKYKFIKKNYILYLFNPFSKIVLQKLINKLEKKNIILIYNNPLNSALLNKKFKLIYKYKNINFKICNTNIYSNNIKNLI
jgi:hypothetical protein